MKIIIYSPNGGTTMEIRDPTADLAQEIIQAMADPEARLVTIVDGWENKTTLLNLDNVLAIEIIGYR